MRNVCVIIDKPSNSARTIARELGIRRVKPERVPLVSRKSPRYIAINWGCALNGRQFSPNVTVLNRNSTVATDKLAAFKKIQTATRDVLLPEFSTTKDKAKEWLRRGEVVLARSTLTGSCGAGITVVRTEQELNATNNALLYVKYVKKTQEYRVHVVKDKAIFTQEKRKSNEIQQTPDQKLIRNHHNGWVFCTQNVNAPQSVLSAAIGTIKALGLDFGAVDIIVEKGTNNAIVLEANTRPGLESPQLIERYAAAFRNIGGA